MLSRKQFLRFTFVLVVIAFITTGVFMSIRNNQDNIVNSVVSSIEKVMGVNVKKHLSKKYTWKMTFWLQSNL